MWGFSIHVHRKENDANTSMHNDADATPCDTQDASTRDHSIALLTRVQPTKNKSVTTGTAVSQRKHVHIVFAPTTWMVDVRGGQTHTNSVQQAQNDSACICSATWSAQTTCSSQAVVFAVPSLQILGSEQDQIRQHNNEMGERWPHTHTHAVPAQKQPHTHCARS